MQNYKYSESTNTIGTDAKLQILRIYKYDYWNQFQTTNISESTNTTVGIVMFSIPKKSRQIKWSAFQLNM